MGIKSKVKSIIADADFSLHEKGIFREKIRVCSIDETIDELLASDKSLVRFGDGEISLIKGRKNATQAENEELAKRLKSILAVRDEGLMITLPDIFGSLSQYRPASQKFWKDHILMSRGTYHTYCPADRKYYNTSFSRNYYAYVDRSGCRAQTDKIKQIWAGKNVIVVEGAATHNGVGNDLLSQAAEIQRIIGPSTNAFGRYDDIFNACMETADGMNRDNMMFLISLGAAAKPLVYDLYQKGYRAIDIGNLDLEYEWFLMGAEGKKTLPKHGVIGEDTNRKAGYTEYLGQIVKYI